MFVNLTPYLTWLGIMLTSKPNDLQNRINVLAQPQATTISTPSASTPSIGPSTTSALEPLFTCSGVGRFAYPYNCRKYFNCSWENQIVRATICPHNLYFSQSLCICTLPQDSGCVPRITTTTLVGSASTTMYVTSTVTASPTNSTWLRRIEASNYYRPANEDRLVIYYDNQIQNPENILWPISLTRNMWESIIMMHGNFGGHNRLYVVFRGQPLSDDLNFSSYLDMERGYINAIEVGSTDWSVENSANSDLITRNIAELFSKNARGIRYPGSEPHWSDIFVYDLYQRVGRVTDSERWAAMIRQTTESNIWSIPLFTQWYLPIYQMYGGGSVLNRFLILREQNFPRLPGDNTTYSRLMNRGEFVHFWSAASGANLTRLATTMFGWTDSLNDMYQQAVVDFRDLSY